ncbi:MAG: sugar-transfer associated ATP-grasp domain-containing protein [Fastidiosipilaceae bacterium]
MRPVNQGWLELFCGVSGKKDFRFVPEDVFYGVIERCLNNCNASGTQLEDKNNCRFYIPAENQPETVLSFVRGVWFDGEMNPIPRLVAEDILQKYNSDVVGKPTMGSCGGANVVCFTRQANRFVHTNDELTIDWVENCFEAYAIQKRLVQEPEVASFNPNSLNTCRIMTFRRPWNGKISVVAGMLRLGCGKEVVDNLAAGGVSVDISTDGSLAEFAVDHDFSKVEKHPVSHKSFSGFKIPYYGRMSSLCCAIAKRIPDFNLLSFDVIVKPDGTPCIIEVNATSVTLAQLQTVRPLFGDETEQVVNWCAAHRDFDRFKHIRTWY